MSKRTTFLRPSAIRIALALAVVALALAAAGMALRQFTEEPAADDATTAGAAVQFALDSACGGNRERYYDMVSTLVAEQADGQVSGTVLYEQFYDGDNFEGRMAMPTDMPNQTNVQSIVYHNGIAYWRRDDGPWGWKKSDRNERTPEFALCQPNRAAGSAGASSSATEIVGDIAEMVIPGEYIDAGEALLDGVRTRRYVRLEEASGAAPTPTAASFYQEVSRTDLRQIFDEVWIDDSGRLFRVKSRLIYPRGLVFRLSIQFSGYGEPNVVTPPVPLTPTPTPTPAPASVAPSPAPLPTQATHWAQIEFKQRVSDAHVLNLLQTNNAMIWRAYMANGDYKRTKGLQGLVDLNLLARLDPATHRSVFDSAVFLTEAQEDSAYTFSQVASGALPDYANAFMDRKGVQQVKTNTEARREVAEILAAYGRAKSALERARNGAPHIYALIVYGKEQGLRRMGRDESVREFAMVPIGSYPTWDRPSQDFLDNDGVSGSSETPVDEDGKALFDLLDGDALYARLEALASIPTPTPEPWPTSTPTPTPAP